MDDEKRDLIIKASAYGFVCCICILLLSGATYGKSVGTNLLLTLIPAYSIYYVITYRIICKGYKNEIKKMSCYGILARVTFTGVTYYVSLMLALLTTLFIISAIYEFIQNN